MAAEVPVSDVLCEAMEYLTKLGSNLRARSESLKEKRIRKDKLKNSHAVQKAADKVLLICELSKKSLENVECGVRKVLSLLKDNQMAPAKEARNSNLPSTSKEREYQFITVMSRKVRIAKKVPVKHYMSVKVLARNMPKSLQDKYPVYHDCKLYRQRKRRERESTKESSEKSNKVVKDSTKETNKVEKNRTKESSEESKKVEKNKTEESSEESNKVEKNRTIESSEEPNKVEKNRIKESNEERLVSKENNEKTTLEKDICNTTILLPNEVESNFENILDIEIGSNALTHKKSAVSDNVSKDAEIKIDSSKLETSINEGKDTKQTKKQSKKKFKHIQVIDDSSENSNDAQVTILDSDDESNTKKKEIENAEETNRDQQTSKNDNLKVSKSSVCENTENDLVEKVENMEETNHDQQTSKNDEVKVSESSVHENTERDLVEKEVPESNRPLIKCVSLIKLLKPDILKKTDVKSDILGKNDVTSQSTDKKKEKLKKHQNVNSIDKYLKKKGRESIDKNKKVSDKYSSSDEDEEYWSIKRKEVSNFQSKKFRININRLPPITENFLQSHNLKKITQNNKVICEINKIVNKTATGSVEENGSGSEENVMPVEKINQVKNALLNESDSEKTDSNGKSPINVQEIVEAVKTAIIDLSVDDHNASELEKQKITENAEDNLVDEVTSNKERHTQNDSDKSEKKDKKKEHFKDKKENSKDMLCFDSETDTNTKEANNTDKDGKENNCNQVKESLLNESDEDKNDKKVKNKQKSKEDEDPSSIEKAKDTLLVESGSDNNDESNNKTSKNSENTEFKESSSKSPKEKDNLLNTREDNIDNNTEDGKENNCNKVKESLLNESDEDKNDKKVKNKQKSKEDEVPSSIEKAKDTLLVESGSDNNNESNNMTSKNSENTEFKESSSKSPKEKDNLLESNKNNNDMKSNDDQLETTRSKKRKSKDSTPVKLKRKRIMESMHAKKMLLTYSSSDTEDEQLKDALKGIKDSLLKEKSSDDENAGNTMVSNESSATSESDDNILRKVKRPKKSNDDISSSKVHKKAKACSNNSEKSKESADERSDSSSAKMGRSRAQPGGSSHSSDSQDANDKDIDGLTNLESLSRRRRRDSPITDNTDSNSVKRKTRNMAKAPLISEEHLLKADSSSASASGVDSDGGEAEDLPPVTLSGLNGSGIDHLAKDDLLGDSDTSNSHNERDESNKKSESEEDHNPKSKRRKANAISSDSEAGSSRRNKRDARDSDFEDSEAESSGSAKRNKRKKKAKDSDASDGSSSNDGSKKKRRRIKQLNDSDEVSGSDSENEGKKHSHRKNIRKVMGKNQLEEATKKAARQEKERIARIAERQKVYNNLEFDESGKPDEVVLEKVILDFDPETKEPLIQLDRGLVKKLKPHQANGIKFMWDACFESVKRIKKDRGSGCILAHCMGLGKTLQVVSLVHTLLIHSELTKVNRVLVVCPLSTVLNWVNEFNMWLKYSESDYEVDVYELSRYKQNSERAFQLQQWLRHGGVCVLGYEMFRNLSADNPKKFKKKMLKNFQEALVDPGPDLVVCDEGHLLKNEKTSLSQSMNRVRTQRRIVLTGTPLQNNLKEYYCMVQFVKPNLLGKYNEYLNRFVNPITNGQYTDSTDHDIRIMKRRSHVLHKMLDGAVQRRDYGVLAPFLPPKHEYVLFITLSEVQTKLYQFYLDNYSRRPLPGKSSGFLFPDFQSLQRIWTHPLVLKYNSERYEIMQQKKRDREEEEDSEGSLVDFIDDDSTPDETSEDESLGDLSDASDDSRKKSKKKKSQKKKAAKEAKMASRRATRANPVELEEEEANNDVVELKAENPTEWWIKLVTDEEIDDMRNSHKLVLLFDILRQCETIGDKLLVFSQSLYSLDLIEHFLGKVDEATQEGRIDEKLGSHVGSWSPGIDYFRLDGSTSCENRSIWCKNFNREDNPRARLFLISTRAGGLGINLVAANRVVIFDVSWNPSHDVQSIFRVYRFGQKKPCYVYRFLAMGTMEEKIYERQVTKQAISKRVIDEQQIDRHYAENDLAELYKFDPVPPTPRPLPPLPKDRLFAEMLREHEAQIYKYHEHDSLLENKEEETLSEEERKAAWEDFENEKNRPPPAPFPQTWPMHNGMVPGLLAQQQQQLAYAALAAMLRKDMPNINDNTIRDMLPHIYNSNPAMFGGYDYGLMQKLSELYKYAPPGGMMSPGMMNPAVMNAGTGGGGAGGALSGSSGLQYEPPWQRQHQQQQQMRLQQLLQHQNQMGAKFYAGGLGSRDPVAMALQQQRAREIMAGEARGRPRGRPPLQPRAPAPHGADVVNLDSD